MNPILIVTEPGKTKCIVFKLQVKKHNIIYAFSVCSRNRILTAALPEFCVLGNKLKTTNWRNVAIEKRSIGTFIVTLKLLLFFFIHSFAHLLLFPHKKTALNMKYLNYLYYITLDIPTLQFLHLLYNI